MKIQKLVLLVLALGAILFTVQCSKDKPEQQNSDTEQSIRDSEIMTAHIKSFKERMEYYRDNLNLKSGGESYTADSAALELESLLNYDFCYTNIEISDKEYVETEVYMPLNDLDRIDDPELMLVYYNKVIDSIQARMADVTFSNKKLLLVDLNNTGINNNNEAIISIGALVGNQQVVTLHNDSWWFGQDAGNCQGNYAPSDGAKQLETRVTEDMLPIPPSGASWYFLNPQYNDHQPPNDLSYSLLEQGEDPDNYLDYKIFYAINDPTNNDLTIDFDVQCMSAYEMDFYNTWYNSLVTDWENANGMKFYHCQIRGKLYGNPLGLYHIQHNYDLWVGERYLMYEGKLDITTY